MPAETAKPIIQKEPPHPTAEMLAPLRDMIEAGAVTDICTWLEKFGKAHTEHREFSKKAINACRELDFDSLRRWTSPP